MPWIAIFALAFALRALNVWLLADTPLARTPHGDGRVYLEWADAIRDGGFAGLWSGEVFYQAPLYPHLLAVFRSLFGESLFALRIAQALVGALTATLIGLATSRMVGRRAGIAAGVLIAIYAPSIWLDGLVQKSALVGFLCASTLTVSTVDSQRGRIALGVAVGLLTLTRGEARLFAIALAAWVFTTRGGRALVPYAAGLALTLAPVLARNVVAGGEWILTTSQSGPNLYIGNAPGSLGTYAPLVPGRGDARSEAEDARRLAEAAETRTLTAREVSSHWRGRAVETMRGDPNAALGRFARKGILALNAAELADTDDFTRAAESSFALRIGPGFGILLALAAAGAALATSDERRRLSVPALLAATQWLALVAFFVFARYRLPLALALAPFAGLSLASLPRVRGRALAAAAVALAIAHVPLEAARPERGRAAALVNEGVLLVDDDRPSEAEVLATQAVELVPGFFDAHRLQGLARLEQERPRDAIAPLERAHALSPDDWQVRAWLGIALGESGDPQRALQFLLPCAMERPEALPIVSNAVGLALAFDMRGEAIDALRRRLEVAPEEGARPFRLQLAWLLSTASEDALRGGEEALRVLDVVDRAPDARVVRAAALAELGRFDEALAEVDRALPSAGARGAALRAHRAAYVERRPWRE